MENRPKIQQQVILGFSFALFALIDAYFFASLDMYSLYILLPGLTISMIFIYGKKHIISIYSGSVIGLVLAGVVLNYDSEYFVLINGLIVPLIYILMGLIFKQSYANKSFYKRESPATYLLFIANASMCSFVGALLFGVFDAIISTDLDIILAFQRQVYTILHSIILITIPLVFLHDGHMKFSQRRMIIKILTMLFFIGSMLYLFSGHFSFFTVNYSILLVIVFYIVFAFLFNYGTLFLSNVSLLIILQVSERELWYTTNLNIRLQSLYATIVVCTFIFIISKEFSLTIKNQNNKLLEANTKISNMFSSTIGLMQLTEYIDQDSTRNKFEYLKKVYDISQTLFDHYDASFLMYKGGNTVNFIDAKGLPISYFEVFTFKSSHFDWASNRPIVYKNPQDNYRVLFGREYLSVKRFLSNVAYDIRVPIQTSESTFGAVVFVKMKDSDNFLSDQEINNIYLFQKMVNSVYNISSLNHKTNTLKDDIVLSLIRTLELFDEYTGSHSEQVADISLKIARKLKLSPEEQSSIYWAGIVHDIGKIGVGEQIVNKKGPLTNIEYDAIKQHPIYGFNILNRSEELSDIALLVKHHHEWFNGNGYPDGLKKHAIPLGSQILSVADAISAMSTVRTSQDVKSKEKIITELQLYSDAQFNPQFAEIAIELLQVGDLDEILYEKDPLA